MPRRRLARERLLERSGEGGSAYARLAGGREMFATGAELAERAGPDVPLRPESVAGYKRQRKRMKAGRARAAETLRRRFEPAVSPSERLGKFLGISTEEAHLYRRDPAARAAMEAHLRRQGRLGELERRETGAFERLGKRLGVTVRGQDISKQVADARVLTAQKGAADRLKAQLETSERRAQEGKAKRETEAASAVGKAAEKKRTTEQTRTQTERLRLRKRLDDFDDKIALYQAEDPNEKPKEQEVLYKSLVKRRAEVQRQLDALGEEEPTEMPKEETVTPEMPGGETVTPEMLPGEEPAPAAREYHTSSEVITAIKGGEIDMAAPGGEDVFYSLDPNAQEEVRAWLRRNGYLE